jgi:hypothetical protein
VARSWSRPSCWMVGCVLYCEMNQSIMFPPGTFFSVATARSAAPLSFSSGASICSFTARWFLNDRTWGKSPATKKRMGCGISLSTIQARETSWV